MSIEGFVYVSGTMALQKRTIFARTVGSSVSTEMSVLAIGAYNLRVFAGVGDADSDDNFEVDEVGTLQDNAIGVSLGVQDLALLLMKPLPDTTGMTPVPSTKSYFALKATGSADLIGVEGVSLGGTLTIEINQGKDTANLVDGKSPAIDFVASAMADPVGYGSSEGMEVITGPEITDTELISFDENDLLRLGFAHAPPPSFVPGWERGSSLPPA